MEPSSQRPIELILARNLLSSLSTPAFLANEPGEIIFYNEAAGACWATASRRPGRCRPRSGPGRSARWTTTASRSRSSSNPHDRAARQPARARRIPHPFARAEPSADRDKRTADRRHRRIPGGDGLLLADRRGGGVKVKVWGAAAPFPRPGRRPRATAGTRLVSSSRFPMTACSCSTPAQAFATSASRCARRSSRCTSC